MTHRDVQDAWAWRFRRARYVLAGLVLLLGLVFLAGPEVLVLVAIVGVLVGGVAWLIRWQGGRS